MKCFLFVFISSFLLSCTQTPETKTITNDLKKDVSHEKINRSTELLPEPDIVDRLKYQKMLIDTAIVNGDWTNETWVLVRENESLTRLVNEHWPDNVQTSFTIWRDHDDSIQLIGEYPFSESGDWQIAYLHYFDDQAHTFAFVRYTGFYNSGCTGDMASEEIVDYFDPDFNRRNRSYELKDQQANKLDKESCEFPYDFPYEVSPDLITLLTRINYPKDKLRMQLTQ